MLLCRLRTAAAIRAGMLRVMSGHVKGRTSYVVRLRRSSTRRRSAALHRSGDPTCSDVCRHPLRGHHDAACVSHLVAAGVGQAGQMAAERVSPTRRDHRLWPRRIALQRASQVPTLFGVQIPSRTGQVTSRMQALFPSRQIQPDSCSVNARTRPIHHKAVALHWKPIEPHNVVFI